ncbi:MAG: extracellular solute-binding protein [Limnochordia bacterium]
MKVFLCRPCLVGVLVTLVGLCVVPSAMARVVYQYNWYAEDVVDPVYLGLIEQFKKEHPGIEVEPLRGGGGLDRLVTLIAGGAPPDIVHCERSHIREMAHKGLLQPLDRFVDTPVRSAWLPGTYSEVQHEGECYGVPWDTDIRGLYWNKDLLGQGGFDDSRAPATLAVLDDMARKLTKGDAEGKFTQLGFIPWTGNWYAVGWLYTFGGEIYDAATKRPTINTPNHVRGFEWIQSYGERYSYAAVTASLGTDPFYQGRLAMIAHESGQVGIIAARYPHFSYGVGEFPHPEYGHNGTWLGGTAHSVPIGAHVTEDTRILLNWLSRKETQASWWRQTTRLPTRPDAIALIRNELPAAQRALLGQADEAWGRPPLWHPPFINRTQKVMTDVAGLKQSPKAALDEAQTLLEMDFAAVFGK